MAGRSTHKWAFKAGMRAGAYSWRSSAKAAARLKTASSEIRAVARSEPVVASEGVIALAECIWPAFEYIDTSSGALGDAVGKTLDELLPVLIDAPADEKTREKWLERLREAIEADGVDYLAPISACFGKIAAYPALMKRHADRELKPLRSAWSERDRYVFFPAANLTLSCLLEAGRYEELLELLSLKKSLLWFDAQYGAEALLRQGREAEALDYAEGLLYDRYRVWGRHEIARFCEGILLRQGRTEDAYQRFGLPNAAGNTYVAMWRDLVKHYPDRDRRAILEDLIATHGAPGKWFATAKTAGFLDVALACAADIDAAPATLIRAARDFQSKEPAFAAQVALQALHHLVHGRGYEPSIVDVDDAFEYLMAAAAQCSAHSWAYEQASHLVTNTPPSAPMAERLRHNLTQ